MKTLLLFIAIGLYLSPEPLWAFAPGFLDVATSQVVASGVSQYSDSFNEATDTPLATHNNNWVGISTALPVTNFKVSGNLLTPTGGYADAGAYHNASASDTSQIVFKAQPNFSDSRYISVRAGANNTGYSVRFDYAIGDNWEDCTFIKNGTTISSQVMASLISWGADHTIKLIASGTSTVTLNFYVDGVLMATYTDSSSPLGAGHPGFYSLTGSNVANSLFDSWQDY